MGRYSGRDYRLGAFWLSQRANSVAWCRTWYCERTRQTRRVSLGTADFEVAKEELNAWFAAQFTLSQQDAKPSDVELAEIWLDYWNNHAQHLRSAKTVQILLRYWLEWWGEGATVADVRDINRQEAFQAHLRDERNLSINSTNRCLEIGRAAINRAWKRGVISAAPFINTLPPDDTKPKGRPLSEDEITRLYNASADHLRTYIALGIGTAARPEALCELTWAQIDFEQGNIQLNPEGRKQTSKRRPTVRMPARLMHRLSDLPRENARVLMFRGKPVGKIRVAWDKACMRAGITENVTPYSLRHTAARWMRMHNVPIEQIAQQLGHKLEGYNMTERYAAWSPTYLKEASEALDALLACLPARAPAIASAR